MNFEKLEKLMNRFVEEDYAPGNTIKVYLGKDKVFDYSCGYADKDKKTKMIGDEYFNIYSCSKIATVTAALQLVEKGIILLNDPLYEYIPEYKNMFIETPEGNIVPAKKEITILNLFNMTAGLTYNTNSEAISKARALTNGKMETDVVIRCLASDPLIFEPGTCFNYSLCHDVLAGLVSIVTGKKFRDYVKENIFAPLGMDASSYHLTPESKQHMATQYRFVSEGESGTMDVVAKQQYGNAKQGFFEKIGIENEYVFGEEYDSGGAGIVTTVDDYVKFAVALANYGLGLTGERILSPATVELMRQNTLDENQIKTFNWKQLDGYGYGLGVRTMMDRVKGGSLSNIKEFGWGGAAGTSVYIDPQIGLAAVYAKHTLNPREEYYQPRVRNVLYSCL